MVWLHSLRAYFAGYSEVALGFETRCILGQGLLQVLDLTFECLYIVQVFVLLGNFFAELVVNLAFLLSHQVCVLLVQED